MKDSLRILVFAVALGFVCSLLLVGVSQATKSYREANEDAEKKRNFLAALDVPVQAGADARSLLAVFDANIRAARIGGTEVYEHVPASLGGQVVGVAVPFVGPGLWGPIHGVVSLEPDRETIRALRVYKQEETPGLGGEIATEAFTSRFAGKKLLPLSSGSPLRILKAGSPVGENTVDGITGATMTCDKLTVILGKVTAQLKGQQDGSHTSE